MPALSTGHFDPDRVSLPKGWESVNPIEPNIFMAMKLPNGDEIDGLSSLRYSFVSVQKYSANEQLLEFFSELRLAKVGQVLKYEVRPFQKISWSSTNKTLTTACSALREADAAAIDQSQIWCKSGDKIFAVIQSGDEKIDEINLDSIIKSLVPP